jgi:protease PrsW
MDTLIHIGNSIVSLHSLIIALIGGATPAILWLLFWLREDKENPEPRGLLFLVFILGMLSVMVAIPIQKIFAANGVTDFQTVLVLAAIEEVLKFGIVYFVVIAGNNDRQPIDIALFAITCALGFAALENAFFLLKSVSVNDTVVSLLTGHLRFLGATLLHAVSTGFTGAMVGLSFYADEFAKKIAIIFGLGGAILLHGVFNFFILEKGQGHFLQVFALLWIVTVIIMLMFEKLRRMSGIDGGYNTITNE